MTKSREKIQGMGSLDEAFRMRVARLFTLVLFSWAPIYSFIMYRLAPVWEAVAVTMGVAFLVTGSLLVLGRGVSTFLWGNWISFAFFSVMLFLGAYAGYGPPPFYWLAIVSMLALVISGVASGVFWLVASLVSLGLYYRYLYETDAADLVLNQGGQMIFEGSVLVGLYILVMLLSLSYDRAKNVAMLELRASEEWGGKIVENAADAILTVDAEGIIYSANEACTEIFGHNEDELRGRPFDVLIPALASLPPLDRAAEGEGTVAVFDPRSTPVERHRALREWDGRAFETQGMDRTDQPVAVEVAIDRLTLGKQERYVLVVRDLTYRQKVEEQRRKALEESKESFRALIENLPDGLIVHRRGEIQYLNMAAGKILRYEYWNQLVGAPISKINPGDEFIRAQTKAQQPAQTDGPAQLEEHYVLTCYGDQVPVESVTFEAMFQTEKALISIVRDLTETRKMRMQMMHMERMSAVGTLAAGVAHEINNPLAYVRGNLEYVEEELHQRVQYEEQTPGDDRLVETYREWSAALQDAYKGTERIRKIVTDLRTYSQRREAENGPIGVAEVIETSIRMAHSGIKHRARLVRDLHEVDAVLGDAASLGQVVLNLLINATHAIPEGRVDENEIRVGLRQDGEQIIIEVSDTGEGISDDVLPQIFDPFFTTKSTEQGTGLGLAICRNIVKGLHGELEVYTAVGEGTTFVVRLPIARGAETTRIEEDVLTKDDEPSEYKARVLIIDDEPMVRAMIRRRLNGAYHVDDVQGPRQAFARLERGLVYDVILCDLMMPEETGMDFYERLKREYPVLKDRVVFITGGAVTEKTAEFLKKHESVVLNKPFHARDLQDHIQGILKV